MNGNAWRIGCVVAGALVAAGAAAAHEEGGEGKEGRGGARWEKMAKALELTPDQQAKLKAEREKHQAASKPLREQARAQLKDLKDLVDKKASDADLSAKLDALKQTHAATRAEDERFNDARAAILTPVQRAKFVLWYTHKMREGRWKRGGGMHAGKDDDGDRDSDDD